MLFSWVRLEVWLSPLWGARVTGLGGVRMGEW